MFALRHLFAIIVPSPVSRSPILSRSVSMSTRGTKRGRGSFRGGSNTRFTGRRGGSSFRGGPSKGGVAYGIDRPAPVREDDGSAAAERFEEVKVQDEIDEKIGFWRFESGRAEGETKVGWLVNMHQVSWRVNERGMWRPN